MRSDRLRHLDIRDAIDVIAGYLPTSREAFDNDPPLQSHLYRHLLIIGEAAWRLSRGIKDAHPNVPWRQIEGMRHIMVHDYFQVDWDIVFETAVNHAPALRAHVVEMLASIPENE